MAGERVDRAEVNKGIEALLSTKRGDRDPKFSLHAVSYYPSEQSLIRMDSSFIRLVAEFGKEVQRQLIGGNAEGTVVIRPGAEGLYYAELELLDTVELLLSQVSDSTREVHLREIPVPKIALAPNQQLIIGHNNIYNHRGSVYTIYTKDAEGSRWSIHVAKWGLQDIRLPQTGRAAFWRRLLSSGNR